MLEKELRHLPMKVSPFMGKRRWFEKLLVGVGIL